MTVETPSSAASHMRRAADGSPRRHVLLTRLSDAEMHSVDALAEAAGMRRGTWARMALLDIINDRSASVREVASADVLERLETGLARAGNNLNQLVRLSNTYGGIDPERALDALDGINAAIEAIERAVDG
ncbi:plasmid mobilization relaxosome protein MobC [Bifidobacterium vespertilionis]|uniref:plasmid mobilization relaxosome protein MobC n=1 Tax=Bifidobacterium vespertilionis TaxID=2562524 RepID=UPI0016896C1E|nr:plasmid mobilization relaxosome protein MobC [Bifidobacterium vespertilionis]